MQDEAGSHQIQDVFVSVDECFNNTLIVLSYSKLKKKAGTGLCIHMTLSPANTWVKMEDVINFNNLSTLNEMKEAISKACVSVSIEAS